MQKAAQEAPFWTFSEICQTEFWFKCPGSATIVSDRCWSSWMLSWSRLKETAMKRWRMGIIGCGWAGERHAAALRTLTGRAELCAVADSDAVRVAARARAWQVPFWTSDYRDLLLRSDLDAVSICLPHSLHAPVAIDAMRAQCHALVEKPLATSLDEVDAMRAAATAAGVCLMVAENVRFTTAYIKAAEMIHAGTLGDVFLVRIAREHEMHTYLRQRPWFLSEETGGILASGGIHDLDLLRMLAGEIEHIYALPGRKVLPEMVADDTSVALIGLRNGAASVIAESFSLKTPAPGVYASVHGSRGSLWFSEERVQLYDAPHDGQPELLQEITFAAQDTFQTEIAHFLDCLEQQCEPLTNTREARRTLAAVLAGYESMKHGTRVYLPGRDG
jgi:predicted dehydrogenase